MCAKDEVKALIFDDMMACAKGSKLRGFEIPKAIHLVSEVNALGQGFSVDNDLLTPTVSFPFITYSRGLPGFAACLSWRSCAEGDLAASEHCFLGIFPIYWNGLGSSAAFDS